MAWITMSSPQTNSLNVFQVYIQDDAAQPLPSALQACVDSVKNASASCSHLLLGQEELRQLIGQAFDSEVVEAFDRLAPYAYKADLARYCLLHAFGGWYFDVSVRANCVLPAMHGIDNLVFRDAPNPGVPSWDVSNGLLYSKRGQPEYEQAIRLVVENCRNEYYGVNALCPTGPNLLGRSFAICGARPQNITGMLCPLTPNHALKNYAYLLPDGAVFAWAKRTLGTAEGGGLAALGAQGSNSYAHLYATRKVYSGCRAGGC
jgi:hypothetical protein